MTVVLRNAVVLLLSIEAVACSAGDPTAASDSSANPAPNEPAPASGVYANVVAVTASGRAGAYDFSVSVESADIDCTQYADLWEVLSEEGVLIYRRILQHSHTDENGTTDPGAAGNTFTRSGGPVDIAGDQTVIVRAHMSNGGYNGMAMRGSVEAGFSEAPDIGSGFAAAVEQAEPQPGACAF